MKNRRGYLSDVFRLPLRPYLAASRATEVNSSRAASFVSGVVSWSVATLDIIINRTVVFTWSFTIFCTLCFDIAELHVTIISDTIHIFDVVKGADAVALTVS